MVFCQFQDFKVRFMTVKFKSVSLMILSTPHPDCVLYFTILSYLREVKQVEPNCASLITLHLGDLKI